MNQQPARFTAHTRGFPPPTSPPSKTDRSDWLMIDVERGLSVLISKNEKRSPETCHERTQKMSQRLGYIYIYTVKLTEHLEATVITPPLIHTYICRLCTSKKFFDVIVSQKVLLFILYIFSARKLCSNECARGNQLNSLVVRQATSPINPAQQHRRSVQV